MNAKAVTPAMLATVALISYGSLSGKYGGTGIFPPPSRFVGVATVFSILMGVGGFAPPVANALAVGMALSVGTNLFAPKLVMLGKAGALIQDAGKLFGSTPTPTIPGVSGPLGPQTK